MRRFEFGGLLLVAMLGVGCPVEGPAADPPDAAVVRTCSAPSGSVRCATSPAELCCDGVVIEFNDGPCQPPPPDGGFFDDAGPIDPCPPGSVEPNCPCDRDGEYSCPTARWRLRCLAGVWMEETGYLCCPGM